eukprot:gene36323-44063_t
MERSQPKRAPKRAILRDISNIAVGKGNDVDKVSKKAKINEDQSAPNSDEITQVEALSQGGSTGMTDSESVDESYLQGSAEFSGYGFELPDKIRRSITLEGTRKSDVQYGRGLSDDIDGFIMIKSDTPTTVVDFSKNAEVTVRMRMILLDWLMQVQLHAMKVLPFTLWLAVGILDRYLSLTPSLKRDQLQLVGATAFLLAIKMEEHSAPALQSFVDWTEGVCQKRDIQQMEFTIMQTLDFQLILPTVHTFLHLLLHRCEATKRITNLSYFLAERMMLEERYFAYSPAQCAAGAIYAARFTAMHETGIHGIVWTEELADESQMDAAQVSLCAAEMLSYARTPIAPTKRRLLDTLHRKYANKATQHVSEVEFPALN